MDYVLHKTESACNTHCCTQSLNITNKCKKKAVTVHKYGFCGEPETQSSCLCLYGAQSSLTGGFIMLLNGSRMAKLFQVLVRRLKMPCDFSTSSLDAQGETI